MPVELLSGNLPPGGNSTISSESRYSGPIYPFLLANWVPSSIIRVSIGEAEKYAAKVFGADRTYFVTNGTSTANKIVFMG